MLYSVCFLPSFLSSKQPWNELLIMSARNAVGEIKKIWHTLADQRRKRGELARHWLLLAYIPKDSIQQTVLLIEFLSIA